MYVSEALARFARSRNISTYICVGTFRGLAPQYQKAGYATGKNSVKCVLVLVDLFRNTYTDDTDEPESNTQFFLTLYALH